MKLRKPIRIIFIFALLVLGMTLFQPRLGLALDSEQVSVTEVGLSKTECILNAGQSELLIANVTPDNASDPTVTWSVSIQSVPDVVTLSSDGLVTATQIGSAVIRATSNSDTSKYAECTVTVTANDIVTLQNAISNAQAKYDGATEGTAVGQYATGSKATLLTAITEAQNVANLGTATADEISQAIKTLIYEVNAFEAGIVSPTGLNATPVVKIGVNHNAGDIAGMYVGLENIKDSTGTPISNLKLSGYQIEVDFDPNQVKISDVLDQTNSGGLFIKNIQTDYVLGLGKVLAACASGSEISSYNKLFFIPMALKGSAEELSNVTVKYLDVRDNYLHKVQIQNRDNLKFQRGRVLNRELGEPNIADAVAGLQYLVNQRNPGFGPEDVNLVNMASITETDTETNVVKSNVKDIIALMQYVVYLRDAHFEPYDSAPNQIKFWSEISNSETGKQLEVYNLQSGDLVEVYKGSDNSVFIPSVTVTAANSDPLVFKNIDLGKELFLRVRVTRNGQTAQQDAFERLVLAMRSIAADNTTSIYVYGLQVGDKVRLYRGDGSQIGGSQSVVDSSQALEFKNVSLTGEKGVEFEFSRTNSLGTSTGVTYRSWKDLINLWWMADITPTGSENLTLQYLENGDIVSIYDMTGNSVPDQPSQSPNSEGKVTFSNLALETYQVEVVRGNIHSELRTVKPPTPHVDFWVGSKNTETGSIQLEVYDLKDGDLVEVFKGSNTTEVIDTFSVSDTTPTPLVSAPIDLGSELYLKVRVTRNGNVGEQDIFPNLDIIMGAIAANNTSSIKIYGLQNGDQVSLYNANNSSQIGLTQGTVGGDQPIEFNNLPVSTDDKFKFIISRTSATGIISTGVTYRSWKDMIPFWWRTDITDNGQENLTLENLESGDVVYLYDSNGDPIQGQSSQTADTEGRVTFSDLELQEYQVEVVRGNIHSGLRTVDTPTPHVDFGVGSQITETGSIRLEIHDLHDGDLVQVFKGCDTTEVIDTFSVTSTTPTPLVLDPIDLGSELYLKVRVTRNGNVGEQDFFPNLNIVMGAVALDNTSSVKLYGLQSGDQVNLYYKNNNRNWTQIGTTQTAVGGDQPIVFADLSVSDEDEFRFEISRTNTTGISTGMSYRSWRYMIPVWWRTDITDNGLENLTIENLESGDVVNLYDNNGNTVPDQPSQTPNSEGKATFSGLELKDYQVEVTRGNIRSGMKTVKAPPLFVDFGVGSQNTDTGSIRLEVHDLHDGDLVQVFKGSNTTEVIDTFSVSSTTPNPLVLDPIDLGSELYLKVRVTRNGNVGEQDIFPNLNIDMGAVTAENTSSIKIYGLQSGDQVKLYYENNNGSSSQIGTTQTAAGGDQPIVFADLSVSDEDKFRFEISRTTTAGISTGMSYRKWKDMISVWWRTDVTDNGRENLTLEYLESGDIVSLYEGDGTPVQGQPSQSPNTEGMVVFSDLALKEYQVEVVRGNIHSGLRTVEQPPVNVDFGVGAWTTGGAVRLEVYDLQNGDLVQVYYGSATTEPIDSISVSDTTPNPLEFDPIDLGGELFLKIRVTRNGNVGKMDIFPNVNMVMGAMASDNTSSIKIYGLQSGDKVGVYNDYGDGSQIGTTQTVSGGDQPIVFSGLPVSNDDEFGFVISRTNGAVVSTGTTYRRWRDMIQFSMMTDLTDNTLENLTVTNLESGDLVNLYDSNGNAVADQSSQSADPEGKVIFGNLPVKAYQVEVVRGIVHSHRQTVYPPTPQTKVTPTPEITGPVRAGDTSVSGTAPVGATVVLSIGGVATDPVTAVDGNWTVSDLTLAMGDVISVTAQLVGEDISQVSTLTITELATP